MRTAVVVSCFILIATLPVLAVAPATSAAAYTVYPAPPVLGPGAGEPSIGVNVNTGAVMFQNFVKTLRVTFNDSTLPASAAWHDVTPPQSIINVDPILSTDSVTGRTFAGGLDGQCSVLAYTDDDGATWNPVGNSCASPAYDHETIGSGPFLTNDPLVPPHTYSRIVYYCAQEIVDECAFSLDGGVTFAPAVPVSPTLVCGSLHGSVNVGANGVAFLPIRSCGSGSSGLSVSKTNGRNWASVLLPGGRPSVGGFDPDVATTPSGWAYVGYANAASHPVVVLTTTNGSSFSGPWDVGASVGIQSTAFTEMVAGDDDRATLVFLGTTTPGNAYAEGFPGVWNLYAATTLDAGATWNTVQITTDPVQRGWICAAGITCPDSGTRGRNLLDFIDAQVDAKGRVVIAFADGCIGACAGPNGTAAQSTSDFATIARQTCGPSLFASVGNLEGATPCSTVAPPPPSPGPLPSTLYARGLLPEGTADGLVTIVLPTDTLSPVPPSQGAPKFITNKASRSGGNAGTIWDAHWAIAATGSGYQLSNSTVTAHVWLTGGGGTVKVALYDAGPGDFANVSTPLAVQNVTIPLTPVPTEIVVTFAGITAQLAHGFELYADYAGTGDSQAFYDSTLTPTRVEIS